MRAGRKPFWNSMLGKSGTGKTHCATRLWQALGGTLNWNSTKYLPRLIYWPDFVDELRDRNRDSGLSNYNMMNDMGNWPFLVLDDIGSERDTTGFASEKLLTLLNRRVGKWTILTSNLDLAGLSKIDDRIASRIVREPGNLWIELDTVDYGLRQK